jgi:hypothetical protein
MAQISGKTEQLAKGVLELVDLSADKSANPRPAITSTWRSPQDQARAMCDNLYNGKRIRYAWAGQCIVDIFDANSKKMARSQVENLMVAKIIELSKKGYRVSKHCVSKEEYDRCNIFDIAPSSMPNPRDFVKAMLESHKVIKVITPFSSNYNDERVLIDAQEPAIHLEVMV